MTNIPQNQFDQLIGYILNNRVADVRQLLENNGVSTNGYSAQDVQIAFLKAVKDNQTFRNQTASYMANFLQSEADGSGFSNFIGQPQLNVVGSIQEVSGTTGTTSTTTKTGSSFWSNLGSLASKENLQSLFNTGLSTLSNTLNNKANKESEERALELERIRLQQIQAQTDYLKSGGAAKKGISTLGWVAIFAGVAGLGIGAYFLFRKKSK